ncbi:hypothetical protein [Myceligenerans crystallogenes]|uniref:TrbL/VirB6 plasmid conjugal transfer protein n=1 Tax=Myceligenerans crystallogenes TaxID=316335 RepID=A0ABN2NG86_9MICO
MACDATTLLDPGRCAKEAAATAFDGALDELRRGVVEATGDVVSSLGGMWVDVSPVDLRAGDRTGAAAGDLAAEAGRDVSEVLGYLQWIGLVVAAVGLILLLARIGARARRGERTAAVGRIGLVLGGVVLIGGASSLAGFVLEGSGPRGGGAVYFLQSALWWYMGAAAVVAVIIAGIRMAWEQRAQPGRDLVRGMITLVVVAGAGVTIIQTLIAISDSFSRWIIDRSLGCGPSETAACFEERMSDILVIPGPDRAVADLELGSLTIIILGLTAILVSFAQIILMIARSGMLVVLAGVLPLAASATTTETGQTWFKRSVGWIAAFILYKPAAAVIYAGAFQLVGAPPGRASGEAGAWNACTSGDLCSDGGTGLYSVLAGLMFMVLAVLALPALMRFVVPVVGAATGGGNLPDAAAVEVPTGARPSNGSGLSGPSGAPAATGRRPGAPGWSGPPGPAGVVAHPSGGGSGHAAPGKPRVNGAGSAAGGRSPAGTSARPGARPGGGAGSDGAGTGTGPAEGPAGTAAGASAAGTRRTAGPGAAERRAREAAGEEGPTGSA